MAWSSTAFTTMTYLFQCLKKKRKKRKCPFYPVTYFLSRFRKTQQRGESVVNKMRIPPTQTSSQV